MNKTLPSNNTKQPSKIKALLLSALVFPGLGQFSQSKKILGLSIMALCAVCVFIVLGEAMTEINAASERMLQSGSVDILRAQEEAREILNNLKTVKFLGALYTLVGLWLFSIIEVFRPVSKPTP
jgi:hypothetical protein